MNPIKEVSLMKLSEELPHLALLELMNNIKKEMVNLNLVSLLFVFVFRSTNRLANEFL